MAIVLDESTRAEYIAQTLASSRATGVVSALGGTVYVEVYDGADVLRASGTMANPWATASGATITIGEVNSAGIIVSSGGATDDNWYCQFRGSNGRFVRGTFGVSTSSADFRWNQSTFETGSKGTLGTATLTALGDTGLAPVLSTAPSVSGTAQVASTLSCTAGTWLNTPTAYAYQWQRSANGTSGWASISGATAVTYTAQSADFANYLRCAVTASNDYGSGTAFSAATAQVVAQPTGGTITTFQVTSATTGTNLPWAFGHAFKQGDVPSGTDVLGDSADFQAVPTTYWPDGSVRHAIIAGRSAFSSAGTVTVTLSRGVASNATALSITDLKAAIPASTTIAVGGTTMTLAGTFLDTPQRTVCTGPVMSNWIYRLAVSGSNHLVIWCDVRLYKGGTVELFPWVENGYLTVASPTSTTGTSCAVTVGGVSRFSQSIDIAHHSRVPLISGSTFSYWSSDPQITPVHNVAYLRDTKLVPNFGWTSPSAATLNGLQQTYTPNTLAGVSSNMGNAGTSPAILPLPGALYATSGDARAYRATVVFGLSGGSWSTHYRDEATNEPIAFASRPNVSLNDGGSPALPSESGTTNGTPVTTHQPSFGYFPWLVTGRWFFLDEHLFWTTWNYLKATPEQRRGLIYQQNTTSYPAYVSTAEAGIIDPTNGTYTVRGAAWCLRTLAQAAAIVPTTHSTYASIKASWDYNVGYLHDRFVSGAYAVSASDWTSGLGVIGAYTDYGYAGASIFYGEGWQQGMVEQALGHAWELSPSTTTATKLATTLDESLKLVTGRTGGSTGWNYRHFVVYAMPYGTNSGGALTWYSTFTDAYTAHKTTFNLAGLSTADGQSLKAHSSNTDLSTDIVNESSWPYFGQAFGALSYAVDRGVINAQAGYLRVRGASNFNAVTSAGFHNDPVYGIVPRVSVGLPTWLSGKAVGEWVSVPNSTLSTHDAAQGIVQGTPQGDTGPRSKIDAWCGGTLKRSGSVYMLGASGGHGDYVGNEVQALALNTNSPGWTTLRRPSTLSPISATAYNDVPAYSNGDRAATHTYYNLQFDDTNNRMFVMPAPGMLAGFLTSAPGGYAYTDVNRPMSFSLATNTWAPFTTHTSWPGNTGSDFVAALVCKNVSTGEIFMARNGDNGRLWKYNPTTNAWTQLATIYHQNYAGSAVDHTRGRMLVVGDYSGTLAARVYDLSGNQQTVSFGGLGGEVLKMSGYPGVVYDEARDSFLVFKNTNPVTVYEVNAASYSVSLFSMSGTVPAARNNGAQNAVQYVPELRGVVFHNEYSGPVKFMRTA